MKTPRTPKIKTWVALASIAMAALVIRVAAVFAIGSYLLEHVTYEHGEIARNLVEGRGFSVQWMGAEGPTSTQAPLVPTLLAIWYATLGVETPLALLAMQLFQAVLGALLAVGVVALAWALLPSQRTIGWLAGSATAVYPTLVYAVTQVQVVSLATLLVVLALWSAARAAQLPGMRPAAACGLICGLLVLTDPILGLVVLVALVVLASSQIGRNSGLVGRLRFPAVAALTCASLVTPWIARNYAVHAELVPVKSTFGYAFWQGNHRRSWGTDKIPLPHTNEVARPPKKTGFFGTTAFLASRKAQEKPARATSNVRARPAVMLTSLRDLERTLWHTRLIDTLYIDDAVLSNQRIAELGQYSEPERSRKLMSEALAYIGDNPTHYFRLCFQRLVYFLWFDPTNPKSSVLAYRLAHMLLAAMAAAGLWVSRSLWRQLWPTYLVVIVVTLFHTLTIVSVRFRIPLEPLALLWAACAAAWAIERCAAVRTLQWK